MKDATITKRVARYRRRLTTERGLARVEVLVPASQAARLREFARTLRRGAMPPGNARARLNAEAVNDRAKLLYHRMVAKRLRRDPALVAQAQDIVNGWIASGEGRDFSVRWTALLQLPAASVAAAIIRRSDDARWLRLSSPFPFIEDLRIDDLPLRRRLWRLARKAFEPSRISGAPSGHSPSTSKPTRSM